MISLKQFMAWDTGLNRILGQQIHKNIHWRLSSAFFLAMTAIFGVSASALYLFVHRNLSQQVNSQLITLVQAATPSLKTIETEGRQSLDEDLPWRDLFSNHEQSLEWFNADGQLLAQEGNQFPQSALAKISRTAPHSYPNSNLPHIQNHPQMRVITIPVYTSLSNEKTLRLEGYLRASQSTLRLENTLAQLRLGLGLGSITTMFLASVSSMYLTRQAVLPMKQTLQRFTQFSAEVSHELRNPLLRISMATEIMLDHVEQLDPADAKKLKIISAAAEQMGRLIDDVLFLARTNASKLPVQSIQGSTVSLDQLLKVLIERFEPQAQAKNIDLQVKLELDLFVKGQEQDLDRLFSNLLENAIKYTQSGGKVILQLARLRQSAVISVQDSGIGIPPEYIPFVFQQFWRSDQARSQEQDGFGLGLSIAQTVAKQHAGEITVTSQVGEGTCFQVRLPLT